MSPLKEACDSHLATKTNNELEDIGKPHLLIYFFLYLLSIVFYVYYYIFILYFKWRIELNN